MSPTTTQTSPKGAKHPAYATCDHHEVQNSPIVKIPKHRTTNKLVRERYTHKHTPPRNENAANTSDPVADYSLKAHNLEAPRPAALACARKASSNHAWRLRLSVNQQNADEPREASGK